AGVTDKRHPSTIVLSNCPLTDFTDPGQRRSFESAAASLQVADPVQVPIFINGRSKMTSRTISRENPSKISRIFATVSLAPREDADGAVRTAHENFPAWRETSLERRSELLMLLGGRLQKDRYELAAMQMFEVGKPAREADADVAEAIDFCHY